MALKAQGATAEAAGKLIAAEFAIRYDGWRNLQNVPALVAKAFAQAGREATALADASLA